MKEPLSSLPDSEFSEFIGESAATIQVANTRAHEVFDRISQFNRLFGAIAAKPEGNVLLYQVPGSREVQFKTIGEKIVVGRLRKSERNPDGCDLAFPELSEMSRKHFQIVRTDEFFVLRDLGSQNGTYINNHLTGNRTEVLKAGDIIVAGGVRFAYTGREEI
jgi:FHA domain